MTDCQQIDPLVTPYVDGEIAAEDRERLEQHLRACRPCRGRVRAEQAVHALLQTRRSSLAADVPPALRSRCAAMATAGGRGRRRLGAGGFAPLALAATLVAIVGGAFLYELTAHSTQLMAAELTADHLKCFRVINQVLGTRHDAATVEGAMASEFDWQVHLPEHPERADLELVGARPCLYAEGLAAHIMYRHRGHPVSVFMLPNSVRADALVETMGHKAAIWSVGHRTFVLIAHEPRDEIERMKSFVHASLR